MWTELLSRLQGGVVQNPGVTWPRHLGRIVDKEVFNFGFSGACRMQPLVKKTSEAFVTMIV